MGLDGGFISGRTEMVNSAKELSRSRTERQRADAFLGSYYTNCNLTGVKLTNKILISKSGSIFDKKEVLDAINSGSIPKAYSYLNKLKYVKELDLLGASSLQSYTCPLSNKSPNQSTNSEFVFIFKCGHLFHNGAFKQANCKECPICGSSFSDEDLIILSPSGDHSIKRYLAARRKHSKLENDDDSPKDTASG